VMTPRVADREGSFVREGTELMEVADLDELRARVYVAEHDMYKVSVGAPARVSLEGFAQKWQSQVAAISPISSEGDAVITGHTQYSGLNPPQFYVADVMIGDENGVLKPGMAGSARIYSERRSLLGLAWQEIRQFVGRKVW
jgi:Barrel-sandwich domain of CusB or HlyD membrane-fusion